jgi:hypothetical protein
VESYLNSPYNDNQPETDKTGIDMPNNAATTTRHIDLELPYSPSWIDRFIDKIDRFPGPIWIFYLLALIGLFLFINLILWIDGGLPFGEFEFDNSSFAFFVVYWFALYQYLSHIGSLALRTFRPLLDVDENEFNSLDYELATLPQWLGWLCIPLALVFTTLTVLGEPEPYGDFIPQTIIPTIFDIFITSFMVAAFFALLIRSIRQLRMVSRLHMKATRINLLDLDPAHAFSDLTARTGAGVIFVLVLGYLQTPEQMLSGVDFYFTGITLLLALAIFIVPLTGMQAQLKEEKKRQLGETNDLLLVANERLHDKIRTGDYTDLEGPKDAIAALIQERELLGKISTWPWEPATFRGFGSTLLLPLLLWVATRLLERFL